MTVVVSLRARVVGVPTRLTDREAMLAIGDAVASLIRIRMYNGIDANGQPAKAYSTKRIWIPFSAYAGTGRRLTPKGGTVSRTGRSMRFDDGYAEYKRKSRKQGQLPRGGRATGPTSEVDWTLTGELRNGIHTAQADEDSVVVQTSGSTLDYADAVNEKRPFMDLAPGDMRPLAAVVAEQIIDFLRRRGVSR